MEGDGAEDRMSWTGTGGEEDPVPVVVRPGVVVAEGVREVVEVEGGGVRGLGSTAAVRGGLELVDCVVGVLCSVGSVAECSGSRTRGMTALTNCMLVHDPREQGATVHEVEKRGED